MAEYQLRLYAIKPGEMDDWIREWREQIVPLRRRHGFRVAAAWHDPADNRFCWLLVYEGEQTFAEADRAYYASPERAALRPDPARHLASTDFWMVQPLALDSEG